MTRIELKRDNKWRKPDRCLNDALTAAFPDGFNAKGYQPSKGHVRFHALNDGSSYFSSGIFLGVQLRVEDSHYKATIKRVLLRRPERTSDYGEIDIQAIRDKYTELEKFGAAEEQSCKERITRQNAIQTAFHALKEELNWDSPYLRLSYNSNRADEYKVEIRNLTAEQVRHIAPQLREIGGMK